MSIQKYVSEFQDYLFNQMPLFDRLNIERASKTDFYGAHKNAEEVLERYSESLQFLEENALNVSAEIDEILNSLEKKIEKINTYATTLIGINSTEHFDNELLTIQPYILSDNENWEVNQKCLMLPVVSSLTTFYPYYEDNNDKKGVSKFLLDDSKATKYINIKKLNTTNITSITYLNDIKDIIETVTLTNNLNRLNLVLEIPIVARYVIIDYYGETVLVGSKYKLVDKLKIIPLTFKHEPYSITSLPTYTYTYGDIFSINSHIDLPFGCYSILNLELSFKDINNKEIVKKNSIIPLNSDGLAIKQYREGDSVYGYWLNGIYEDLNLTSIPINTTVVYKPIQEEGIEVITESALRFNIKNAKTIDITPTLYLYSLASTSLTPRIFYLTGLTKNV